MAFLKFVSFAVFCLFAATSANPVQPHTHDECGRILTGSSGGISYKPFEAYAPNEKCVWVIRTPQAVQYTINIYNLGEVNSKSVSLAALSTNQKFAQNLTITVGQNLTVDANVLIVTFTSDYVNRNNVKGFSMFYTSVSNGSSLVSPNSVDTIVSSVTSSRIRHSSQSEYSNNELSTFIFAPNFLYETSKQTRLHYTRLGWDGLGCEDSIQMYEIAAGDTWKLLGEICGGHKDLMIASRNMLMLVFKTDAAGVGSGFTLDYTYEA